MPVNVKFTERDKKTFGGGRKTEHDKSRKLSYIYDTKTYYLK
ncbi:MAG: hypothetical protein ACPL3A_06735 [Thermoanaerobacteraceae bacterium]